MSPSKPLLVLINPASGTKLARRMFRTILQPELDKKHITYDVVETEYAGHAKQIVLTTSDLKGTYSGIVTISGKLPFQSSRISY